MSAVRTTSSVSKPNGADIGQFGGLSWDEHDRLENSADVLVGRAGVAVHVAFLASVRTNVERGHD